MIRPGADPIDVRDESDYREYSDVRRLDTPYVLEPGCTIHGMTRELITLPRNLCAFLEGRSRFARLHAVEEVTPQLPESLPVMDRLTM